ncbi:hypothetical protein SVIO_042720 [Streptomyces violaceusniger]|uniref:Tetratrico peptide repeat group 5 domain-containing protein n=1 Tax=Streptomyces violaceusniger TaxID=68280 RepID=A0A4D4L6K2_STRVO|nr:hypothetical protein SVIO_042720 [Streptomyces violaceusniger]
MLRMACEGEHEEAPYWLAEALRRLGRTEEADRWLRVAAEAYPDVLAQYGEMARLAIRDPG